MTIKAEGKFLNSFPLSFVLTQGEQNADSVDFEVPRYYEGVDLGDMTFVLNGVNANGDALSSILTKVTNADTITLTWFVSGYFTAVAGTLQLSLCAYTADSESTDNDGNLTYDADAVVLQYILAPIIIREALHGTSGTVVPDLTAQAIAQLMTALETAQSTLAEDAASLGLTGLSTQMSTLQTQVASLATTIDAFVSPIVALTQAEYNALESISDNRLYLIVEEAEA